MHRATWVVLALLIGVSQLPAQQKSTQQEKRSEKAGLNYLLFLPEGYDKGDKKWPLLVFLHGAGETGNNLANVKKHGPPKIVEKKRDFPFVVVSPQAPTRGWKPASVIALIDEVAATEKIDKDRIYLTGLSMGGFGTWATAAAYPDRFAAIVPICGGGDPRAAAKIKDLPVWAFHGAKDAVVKPERTEAMIKALKDAGAKNVKYTLYPDAAHDSWTATYNNEEVYKWLLSHSRKKGG